MELHHCQPLGNFKMLYKLTDFSSRNRWWGNKTDVTEWEDTVVREVILKMDLKWLAEASAMFFGVCNDIITDFQTNKTVFFCCKVRNVFPKMTG
jgi:hypothetical protein